MAYTIGYTTIPHPQIRRINGAGDVCVVHVLPKIREVRDPNPKEAYRVYFIAAGRREDEIFYLSVASGNNYARTIDEYHNTFVREYEQYMERGSHPTMSSIEYFVPDIADKKAGGQS